MGNIRLIFGIWLTYDLHITFIWLTLSVDIKSIYVRYYFHLNSMWIRYEFDSRTTSHRIHIEFTSSSHRIHYGGIAEEKRSYKQERMVLKACDGKSYSKPKKICLLYGLIAKDKKNLNFRKFFTDNNIHVIKKY